MDDNNDWAFVLHIPRKLTTNRLFKDSRGAPDALNAQVIAERLYRTRRALPARQERLPSDEAHDLTDLLAAELDRVASAARTTASRRTSHGATAKAKNRLRATRWVPVPVIPVELVSIVAGDDSSTGVLRSARDERRDDQGLPSHRTAWQG
jgi:hypothetical protein